MPAVDIFLGDTGKFRLAAIQAGWGGAYVRVPSEIGHPRTFLPDVLLASVFVLSDGSAFCR